jgi:hypothetical protein
MPVYPCPECGAQLRPANPVPAGKKLRCPKCQHIFAPAGTAKAAAKAAPAVQPMAPAEETYGLSQHEEAHNPEAARNAFDPIKDRFKLSARGPALILVVKPSTALLATGCLICAMAIAGSMYAVWPMIFKIEDTKPPDKMAKFRPPEKTDRHFKDMTPDEYTEHWWILAGSVFQFGWGAVVCAGASKMHALETYPLALIGSVMSFVGPFVPLGISALIYALEPKNDSNWLILPAVLMLGGTVPISFWCVSTLRNKKVLAGFQEEKPDEF